MTCQHNAFPPAKMEIRIEQVEVSVLLGGGECDTGMIREQ
jgi:hypothetical protein